MDVHGAWLSKNGDLTFNYSDYGLMQMDFCGRVKWRAPYMTHHTVVLDEQGHIWTLQVVRRDAADPTLPNIRPPFRDVSVLELAPDGSFMRRFDVFKLLQENGYQGLLYMSPTDNESSAVYGDATHVNDVDVFPSTMKPGLFKAGDVMVSMRNADTVFVFDPATRKIKATVTGRFVRQHDPDFVDGWTISVFDNNNVGEPPGRASSRVVEYSFQTQQVRTLFAGSPQTPFFTSVMGKHQRLPNGNLLLTEGQSGRAIEVDPSGQPVWEYFNIVAKGLAAHLTEATRIPPSYLSVETVDRLQADCRRRR
jgi:hypothetical protein